MGVYYPHFTGEKIEARREAQSDSYELMHLLWRINAKVSCSWFKFRDALRASYVLISVPETSVKMSVIFVANLPCVGPPFCMGTMAPVKELQRTACFWLLLDSLVQLQDIPLVVGVDAPSSPLLSSI